MPRPLSLTCTSGRPSTRRRGDAHLAAGRRELDGVVDEVRDRLAHEVLVAADERRAWARRASCAIDFDLGEGLVELEDARRRSPPDRRRSKRLFARAVLHRRNPEEGGDRRSGAWSRWSRASAMAARRSSTVAARVSPRSILARATASGVRRSCAILSPTLFNWSSKSVDLVEHQIDVARDPVDVVAIAHLRQARFEIAAHDVGDRVVDVAPAAAIARRAKNSADREDQQDRRREREGERAQHRLAQSQASRAGSVPAEARRRRAAGGRRKSPNRLGSLESGSGKSPDEMRLAVDRYRRHRRHVAEHQAALRRRTKRHSRAAEDRA